jgi:Na+/melibiose symporter-like transporter
VDALLFLAAIAAAGALPVLTVLLRKRRLTLLAFLGWIAIACVFFLRPAANSPHAFGIGLFLIFLFGWLAALGWAFHPELKEKYWGQKA